MNRSINSLFVVLAALVGVILGGVLGAERPASVQSYTAYAPIVSVAQAAPIPVDPRAPWLSITETTAPPPVYHLVSLVYQDGSQSNGSANYYVSVVDEHGAPLAGVNVYQAWPDGNAVKQTPGDGAVDFFMSGGGCFNPALGQVGPYSSYIENSTVSDIVKGMGLPVCQHVSYILKYQRVVSIVPTPTITPTPTPPPVVSGGDAALRKVLASGFRSVAANYLFMAESIEQLR